MAELAPYLVLLRAQIRSQTTYRLSFALDLLFSTVMTLVEIVAVLVIFSVNPSFGGFTLEEGVLIAGFTTLAFTLSDFVFGNIDDMPRYVRTGLLDAVLVRPLGVLGQLLVLDFAPHRVGRVLYGLVVFVVALSINDISWTPAKAAMAIVAPIAGAVSFGCIFILGGTLTFWLVDSSQVSNAFTYGGREFSTYPVTVFGGWVRWLFSYGLGLASVAYLPALALLGKPDPAGLPGWVPWCAPLAVVPWALAARTCWRFGVRHYRSTGS